MSAPSRWRSGTANAPRAIDAYLQGRLPTGRQTRAGDLRPAQYLVPFSGRTQEHPPVLDIIRRQSTFDEVVGGLDEANALYEARRCMSWATVFECDTCYGVCPDNAVIKLGPGKR